MKLTYNEFEILVCIEKEKRELSQRKISKITSLSLGTVNKTITSLLEKKLINEDNTITKRGLKELEPYRVKRAIFLAAGFGSRLVPITLNTPKPLVLVNGKKIIETLLDAVVKAEIPEIIIVTGYLNEQFEILLKKYPNIKFIYNKKFASLISPTIYPCYRYGYIRCSKMSFFTFIKLLILLIFIGYPQI